MPDFPVLDASDWEVVGEEPGGETAKEWLRSPIDKRLWLSKSVTLKELPTGDIYRRGQDWAEKLSAEIAILLGVPAARVELGVRHGLPGLLSEDLKDDTSALIEASDFLIELDGDYEQWTESNKIRNRVGHNLANIEALLADVRVPPGADPEVSKLDASSVFLGYLLFDALIANVDRHDRNWALLRRDDGTRALSPSYDHGSAFGSGLHAGRRAGVDVSRWCGKGMAQRFEGGASITLLDFARMFADSHQGAYRLWVERIAALDLTMVESLIARIPVMSELERRFALQVLSENQRRICDDTP